MSRFSEGIGGQTVERRGVGAFKILGLARNASQFYGPLARASGMRHSSLVVNDGASSLQITASPVQPLPCPRRNQGDALLNILCPLLVGRFSSNLRFEMQHPIQHESFLPYLTHCTSQNKKGKPHIRACMCLISCVLTRFSITSLCLLLFKASLIMYGECRMLRS